MNETALNDPKLVIQSVVDNYWIWGFTKISSRIVMVGMQQQPEVGGSLHESDEGKTLINRGITCI